MIDSRHFISNPPAILVTGARGQVGIRCLHHWLEAGTQVQALTRDITQTSTHPNLTWVKGDLEKPESLEAWEGEFPQTVICTAPIWFVPPLLPLCIAKGVKRIVAFSSTSVHTKKQSGKLYERELATLLRHSEEQILEQGKAHGIAVTILRPTLVYGLGMDKNITSIAQVMRKLPVFPVPISANGLRQPVHADDLAMATVQVLNNPQTYGKVYDVGGGETLTYRQMLKRIARALNKHVLLFPIPAFAWLLDIGGKMLGKPHRINGEIARRMQKDMAFDLSAAANDFGWNPRPFLDKTKQPAGVPFF